MKSLLFFSIILSSLKLYTQTCPIEPWVEEKMLPQVEKFVLANVLSDSNHLYFDSVYPPQTEIDEALSAISSVFNSLSQEDLLELTGLDSIFHLDIFSIPSGVVVKVDSMPDWLHNLRVDSLESGNTEIDSFLAMYNLQYKNDYYLITTNSSYINFTHKHRFLNYYTLIDLLESLNEINLAELHFMAFIPEACFRGMGIREDTISFSISNQVSPFGSDSYWKFYVNQACEANLIDKSVNPCGFNSISNVNRLSLSFYPNPAKEKIYIENIDLVGKDYKMFSMIGELLQKGRLSAEKTIDIKNLSNGIYFIQIGDNMGKFMKK